MMEEAGRMVQQSQDVQLQAVAVDGGADVVGQGSIRWELQRGVLHHQERQDIEAPTGASQRNSCTLTRHASKGRHFAAS